MYKYDFFKDFNIKYTLYDNYNKHAVSLCIVVQLLLNWISCINYMSIIVTTAGELK